MVAQWPLTGRDEELRLVSEALAEGEHSGIVIGGPAGVGKTRLARAATESAAGAGWAIRRIAGTATGRQLTLGAFARWADDLEASPLSLTRKVFTGLAADAEVAPLLVFVDDAHLLDDLSAMIVHQLVLQNVASVIATIRSGEPAPDAVTALWKDSLLRRLELQPLSHNESDVLLRTVLDGPVSADCAARMWTLSRGNVLFLNHLVEHERDSGRLTCVDGEWCWAGTPAASASLVDIVEQQIGAVPEDVREVVDLVAVAEPVDRALLSSLAGPDAIEAAERRGLIRAGSDAVYVGHPLYAEIRLNQCGPLRLRRLRGRVAAAMAKTEAVNPLRLGLLMLESDLPPDAGLLTTAANICAYRLDLETAERLARAAADARPQPSTRLTLAYILFLQEKGEAAEEILDTLDDADLIAPGFVDGVTLHASNLLWPLHDPDGARTVLDGAIALGDDDRNQALRTFLAVLQATTAEPAEVLHTMSAVDYHRLDDYGRVMACSAQTIALGDLGRVREAGDRARAAYRVLDESPVDSFQGSGVAEFHAFALLAAGCVDEAQTVTAREHRQRADIPGQSQTMAIASLGLTALGAGDLPAALRHLDAAAKGFGGYGETIGLQYRFRIARTEVLARLGDVDGAVAALEIARSSRHPAYVYVESAYLMAAAWVAAARDLVAEARELTCQAAEFARVHGQLAREVLSLQTAVQFGDASGVDRLAELAGPVEGPRAPLAARYARALAEDNAAALDQVSREYEAMADPLVAADAAAQAATSHRLAGRKGSALTASGRAHQLAKDCGGAVSPALAAARVPLPFTRREHEIAQLVSDGLTNKEIAAAISLSVRTVEGHVYQASAKAGVTSRSELSALVRQFST
jgi:DNA-binding CsgD family transcriptional regulator